jgi:hypothetical protein
MFSKKDQVLDINEDISPRHVAKKAGNSFKLPAYLLLIA